MVKLAYAEPPAADGRRVTRGQRKALQRCAFGCLVVLAALGGWALRGVDTPAGIAARPVATDPVGVHVVSLARVADPDRVILHLDSAAPDKMLSVLDEAERLLNAAEREGRAMQLEVLANSRGIELLRAGHSPHAARMSQLKQRHMNLQWVACGQSIARLTSEGQKIELLPHTRTAPTAVGEIVTRLQQGWTYVRV
jgi:intracellular sulfur oxidation DsrE/DsrF family protein